MRPPQEMPLTETAATAAAAATTDPVQQALDAYKAAVFAKDVDAFVALYTADVRVFDMWGEWQVDGLPAWRAMAADWFGSLGDERVLVDFSDLRTTVDGGLAVGHVLVAYAAIDLEGGVLRSLTSRFSVAFRREGDAWKIFHEHSSAPLDHATTKAILTR